METRDELKRRLKVTGEFISRDNHKYWLTDRCQCIDPDWAGTSMPDVLMQLIRLTKTPLDMIYRIQQGLGIYDMNGNQLPFNAPKPTGYRLFEDALAWLENNYPDIGGWFYAVDTIHRANKQEL